MNVTKQIRAIQKTAEKIRNDGEQRFPEAATPGDCWRQGDVYITLLETLPRNAVPVATPQLQLVPGNTQGSRHCLDSLDGVSMYSIEDASPLDGPVLECRMERTITHPEHGNVVFPPGIYGIHYQRDLDSEERQRRVVD